eukprot:CAMPEP_0177781770 /NCGR_PEP_ID=MMETSP0491_2-20121128/18055_1 /TAXON_ID=63592 /ORGANISM="Tetraselmis chuii, Strain PLY429" /LENGTH=548 /DNA_ID=CAMNT_0019301913 /DNA_START=81 /DNA_END=1728 /DNA_ORIENTATION=+
MVAGGMWQHVCASTVCEHTSDGMSSNIWAAWRPKQPTWTSVAVATWQDLARQICAAQGSGWDESENECGQQTTPPSPVDITLTSHIWLEGRQLPVFSGKSESRAHAGESDKSVVSMRYHRPVARVPRRGTCVSLFEHCAACSVSPSSATRLDNTPIRVATSTHLWLENLELVGAQSRTSGGLLSMDRGSEYVWTNLSLESEMSYVNAKNILFSKGFSEQQGGAAYVQQGCMMELHDCEFRKNYAGMFGQQTSSSSAHDVLVANYGKLLLSNPTPDEPQIRLATASDEDRELGQCIISDGSEGGGGGGEEDQPTTAPAPVATTPGGQSNPPPPPSELPLGGEDGGGGGTTVHLSTVSIVIIACSITGALLLAFLGCLLCCAKTMNSEEREMAASSGMKRRLSRALSTTVTGLTSTRSMRPKYVEQGDYMVTLWEEKQRAEEAAVAANRRALEAERTLVEHGVSPPTAWRAFASGVSSAGGSLYRSLSRAFSMGGGRRLSVERQRSLEDSVEEAPHQGASYAACLDNNNNNNNKSRGAVPIQFTLPNQLN